MSQTSFAQQALEKYSKNEHGRVVFSPASARAARGRAAVAAALTARGLNKSKSNKKNTAAAVGGRRTRRSSGVMGSVKKFFGMTRRSRARSRGRSRRQ